MRYVKVAHIESGMILARPLLGDNGRMLVAAGATITDNILKHIYNMGLQGVYIEQVGFEDIIIEDTIDESLRSKAYEALVSGDYDRCVLIAKEIAKEMRSQANLDMDLLDIKSDKDYEYRHCISVCVYATAIGISMGFNEENLNNLAIAGILHDIGKFSVKKRVLNTKSIYNDKQMDEMKKHPMYSYEELKDNPNISSVSRNSILFHHENLDGSGYYGISGDKLGLMARILRVADTYDALTATRKHRVAFSPAYAISELVKGAGTLYDENVVRAFALNFPIYPKGFPVKLINGEKAVVVNNRENNRKPIIRFFDGREVNLATDKGYKDIDIEDIS